MAAELQLELVAPSVQKAHHPTIQIGHLDALHLIRCADGTQVVLDVRRQVAGECGEQDAALGQVSRQPAGAVHGHHGLAGAGAAEQAHRAVPIAFHQSSLGGMQEYAPAFQRRVEHGFEFQVIRRDREPHLRFGTLQSRVEVLHIDLRRRFPFSHQIFVGLAG